MSALSRLAIPITSPEPFAPATIRSLPAAAGRSAAAIPPPTRARTLWPQLGDGGSCSAEHSEASVGAAALIRRVHWGLAPLECQAANLRP